MNLFAINNKSVACLMKQSWCLNKSIKRVTVLEPLQTRDFGDIMVAVIERPSV